MLPSSDPMSVVFTIALYVTVFLMFVGFPLAALAGTIFFIRSARARARQQGVRQVDMPLAAKDSKSKGLFYVIVSGLFYVSLIPCIYIVLFASAFSYGDDGWILKAVALGAALISFGLYKLMRK